MAPDRTPAPRSHADQDHRQCLGYHLALSLCLDAGVSAVEAAVEGDAGDLEAGHGEHRLEKPAVGAELGADVLGVVARSEEHTSELQSRENLVCRLLLEKKK